MCCYNNQRSLMKHAVNKPNIWVWRSLVACLNGVQEAGGSNPLTQTYIDSHESMFFFMQKPLQPVAAAVLVYSSAAFSPFASAGAAISPAMNCRSSLFFVSGPSLR